MTLNNKIISFIFLKIEDDEHKIKIVIGRWNSKILAYFKVLNITFNW
jgi:hypothetical protein